MSRELNQQKYCSWCGSGVVYDSIWSSKCSSCDYRSYISPKPACSIILISEETEILFVKRAISPNKGSFDIPGGFMDMDDSTLEDCTYREASEELGINRESLGTLDYVCSITSPYDWGNTTLQNIVTYFRCRISNKIKDSISLDTAENSEMKWVSLYNIEDMDLAWQADKEALTLLSKKERLHEQ